MSYQLMLYIGLTLYQHLPLPTYTNESSAAKLNN